MAEYEVNLGKTDMVDEDDWEYQLGGTDGVGNETGEGDALSEKSTELVVIQGKAENYLIRNMEVSNLGMGNKQAYIYRCTGSDTGKEYAIKIYRPEKVNINAVRKVWTVLENNSTCQNVTRIYEYGQCSMSGRDCYYVVMDVYLPIDRNKYKWNGTDSEEYRNRILSFVEDMTGALKFLNLGHQIFHSDIKPDNIMLNPQSGRHVLIDFGGAGQAKSHQETGIVAGAITAQYTAPETTRGGYHVNEFSECYLMGLSLAELMDGVYPGNADAIEMQFGAVKNINLYRIPADLPEYYENLLRGLLYEADDKAQREEHRWNSGKVGMWLREMRAGQTQKAAAMNQVPAKSASNAASRESLWDFGGEVVLEVGEDEKPYTFRGLEEMADTFLDATPGTHMWEDAIRALQGAEEIFTENNVKSHVLKPIREGIRRMQNVNPRKGESVNAEFFKFLYKYVSDKQKFRWKDLPNVTTLEEFGFHFYMVLKTMERKDGFFGDWWKNVQENKRAQSSIFAEIFYNHVFSAYVKRAASENEELLKQTKKVEDIFAKQKMQYSREELTEMLLLARMLWKNTSYVVMPGYEFSSFEEFRQVVMKMSQDPQNVDKVQELMSAIKNRAGEYYPSIMVWKMMEKK